MTEADEDLIADSESVREQLRRLADELSEFTRAVQQQVRRRGDARGEHE